MSCSLPSPGAIEKSSGEPRWPICRAALASPVIDLSTFITTREAAKILGVAQRTVNYLCDLGTFEYGEWRRTAGGRKRLGHYRVSLNAVMRIKQERAGRAKSRNVC